MKSMSSEKCMLRKKSVMEHTLWQDNDLIVFKLWQKITLAIADGWCYSAHNGIAE